MNRATYLFLACLLVVGNASAATPSPVTTLLDEYRREGGGQFDAAAGEALWNRRFSADKQPAQRSCASCHTANPREAGKHVKTGKPITPLAPSVNSKRLSDIGEIRKWLRRNCNWTLGRECSAQEKGDLLSYLKDL